MVDSGLVALDQNGEPVDDFDELESALSGGEIPGDEVTGEETQEKDETSVEKKAEAPAKEEETPPVKEEEIPAVEEVSKDTKPPEPVDAKEKVSDDALRSQLREQKKQIAIMQAKLDRLGKRPAVPVEKKSEFDEDEGEEKTTEEVPEVLSNLEVYQEKLSNLDTSRLDNLVALMQLNPNYTDVEEVCTRARFDDIFEASAAEMVREAGGDPVEAAMAIELHVWSKPNPYAYMYDLIKKHHPDFKGVKEDVKEPEAKPEAKVETSGKKKTTDSPLSALDLSRGGGGKSMGEWTAEKIDSLPEDQLDKVPKDVYNAYLNGDLDK